MDASVEAWETFFSERVRKHQKLVDGYIAFVKQCLDRGIPPIFEPNHAASLMGLLSNELGFLESGAQARYRHFRVSKKLGGEREIKSPMPMLLQAQRWILDNILYKVDVSEDCYGGVRQGSIFRNAAVHLNQNAVLKLDIVDFFGSVKLARGINLFKSLGYPYNVAKTLALLCFDEGSLPQGAATSPMIANIVSKPMDNRLKGLATKYSLNYSRYFDDMTFSGSHINMRFVEIVSQIVQESGFAINANKTKLIFGRSPKYVTGLSIGGETLRLPRADKREIRNQAFQLVRRGVEKHSEAIEDSDPLLIEKTIGRVSFWLQAEPECKMALKLMEELRSYQKSFQTPTDLPVPRRAMPLEDKRAQKDEMPASPPQGVPGPLRPA